MNLHEIRHCFFTLLWHCMGVIIPTYSQNCTFLALEYKLHSHFICCTIPCPGVQLAFSLHLLQPNSSVVPKLHKPQFLPSCKKPLRSYNLSCKNCIGHALFSLHYKIHKWQLAQRIPLIYYKPYEVTITTSFITHFFHMQFPVNLKYSIFKHVHPVECSTDRKVHTGHIQTSVSHHPCNL